MFKSDVELPEGGAKITPGVKEVTIVGLSKDDEDRFFNLKLKPKDGEDDNAKNYRFFMSENAKQLNFRKFQEILMATNSEAVKVEAESLGEYINKVEPMIKGRSYIQKFSAKEFVGDDGIGIATEIPISMRSKKNPEPTIAAELGSNHNLKYDENNQYDYKKLEEKDKPDSEAPAWE